MPDTPTNLTNRRLGPYRCIVRLATGGFGTIWKAEPGRGKRKVAIKVPNQDMLSDRKALAAFRSEYDLCKKFKHPGLLKYLDFQYLDQTPYMVMEYFESQTLKAILLGDGATAVKAKAQEIIVRAAEALACIHEQGVIHCDVKPENILVNKKGAIRLIDFSIAQKCGSFTSWLPFLRRIQGTPTYMAPEQIQKKRLTPAVDMYALGATIYEFLGGQPPFIGNNQDEILSKALKAKPGTLTKLNTHVTAGLDKLVLSMLAKRPENRPRDMQAFLRQLARVGVYRDI